MADEAKVYERGSDEYYDEKARQGREKNRKYHEITQEIVNLFAKHGLQVNEVSIILDDVRSAVNRTLVTPIAA